MGDIIKLIVKLVVIVLVLVIAVFALTGGIKDYAIPFFKNLFPSNNNNSTVVIQDPTLTCPVVIGKLDSENNILLVSEENPLILKYLLYEGKKIQISNNKITVREGKQIGIVDSGIISIYNEEFGTNVGEQLEKIHNAGLGGETKKLICVTENNQNNIPYGNIFSATVLNKDGKPTNSLEITQEKIKIKINDAGRNCDYFSILTRSPTMVGDYKFGPSQGLKLKRTEQIQEYEIPNYFKEFSSERITPVYFIAICLHENNGKFSEVDRVETSKIQITKSINNLKFYLIEDQKQKLIGPDSSIKKVNSNDNIQLIVSHNHCQDATMILFKKTMWNFLNRNREIENSFSLVEKDDEKIVFSIKKGLKSGDYYARARCKDSRGNFVDYWYETKTRKELIIK